MKQKEWKQFELLEQYFMQRLINITQEATKGIMRYLVWQVTISLFFFFIRLAQFKKKS
jgi:hypothetical protein